jgi:hypothetical protein
MGVTRADRRAAAIARVRDARGALRPSVSVEIEDLVISGWPRSAAYDIGDAIRHELTRLLSDRGVPSSLQRPVQIASVDAGAVTTMRNAQPGAIGTQIAGAVYGVSPR